ncbi:hypothetical protein [Anaerofustis butyriciformans]|uniref:hypothetical protein n=1 Tax=Anaerofustis butyriciformans TaxID=3108533 RepID=UPI003F8BD84B
MSESILNEILYFYLENNKCDDNQKMLNEIIDLFKNEIRTLIKHTVKVLKRSLKRCLDIIKKKMNIVLKWDLIFV